ncbi:MAG TPA: hypothetical protein VHB77_06020 [Planctomycetaceae bacterium]|nr:hypothetical protein [Planctomycetaceae bacterium]
MKRWIGVIGLCAFLAAGCMESLEKQTAKSPNSIVGKKTQDIGKFDPNAQNQQVSDSKIHASVGTGAVSAYGPTMERISKIEIDHAVNLFQAENGRYPQDYDEFMEKIIKANNIQLPVLPAKGQYKYDEANHALVVVREAPEGAAPAAPAAGEAPAAPAE